MMGTSCIQKSALHAALIILICAVLMMTVSATTVDLGKNNQLFIQKGIVYQSPPGNSGNSDLVKMQPRMVYPAFYTIIKPSSNASYFKKAGAYTPIANYGYKITLPVYYPSVTPVPEQGIGVISVPGSSNSTLGGLIIRGNQDGDWISLRSNFYNPSKEIYNGRWQIDVGVTPAYWENMILPGSYTIKIAAGPMQKGLYYCETVTVMAGQTTIIQANSLCPLCSSC